jgi:peptidoglycan-N-acetylglucosamine deacetylase
MYLVKTPQFIQQLFPRLTWKIPTTEKVIFLTFDDGPIPEVTPWVLDQLKAANAKATFFCVGDNIRKYPEVFQRVVDEGHAVGNHSFHHLSGWSTDLLSYLKDVRRGAHIAANTALFRPPYGRIRPKQAKYLKQKYNIVMWDVLSADFDPDLSGEQCFLNVADNAKQGSIIVFHDSLKAEANLKYALPKVLEYFGRQGYRFEAIRKDMC